RRCPMTLRAFEKVRSKLFMSRRPYGVGATERIARKYKAWSIDTQTMRGRLFGAYPHCLDARYEFSLT
ncbi:MAG: hypothetical protein IIX86_08560, partial [Clostridia bacterium]|nr:hypothetical protein [Clostridia bacterium]